MTLRNGALLLCFFLALLPPQGAAFSIPGSAIAGSFSIPHKISSCSASANDGDLFFDESSSEKDIPSSSSSSSPPEGSSSGSKEETFDLSATTGTGGDNNNNNNNLVGEPAKFPQGAELQQLRNDLESYRENLKWAQATNDTKRIESLRQAIDETEKRDPEIVYNKALFLIAEAKSSSSSHSSSISAHDMDKDLKEKLLKHWEEQAEIARAHLPRFQMGGLWLGTYGTHGAQLINVTYSGDTLIATKVTGDATVPRGEVSFTAELTPNPMNASSSAAKVLNGAASVLEEKYGGTIYPGKGQLAKKGFKDSKYIDGIFIVYDAARFSFSWVPSKHHVFFVRPSATETLRLLRDVISKEDEVENQRAHLARCFDMDMTTSIAREQARQLDGVENDPFRRIALQKELELLGDYTSGVEGISANARAGNLFAFWRANKWKKYIDRVLRSDDEQDKPPSLQ